MFLIQFYSSRPDCDYEIKPHNQTLDWFCLQSEVEQQSTVRKKCISTDMKFIRLALFSSLRVEGNLDMKVVN